METKRITYAQEKLLNLIKERNLRQWCIKNNFDHTLFHKLATGERIPTYRLMCESCDVIAPAEWLFFTDEKITYNVQTLPKWDVEQISYFIKLHKSDYNKIAQDFEIDKMDAYSLFVSYRLRPNFVLFRKFIKKVNPIYFFTDDISKIPQIKYPNSGDIVCINEKNYFVITSEKKNKENNFIIACPFEEEKIDITSFIKLPLIYLPNIINTSKEKDKILNSIKNFLFD